jgi:hypothetical protein
MSIFTRKDFESSDFFFKIQGEPSIKSLTAGVPLILTARLNKLVGH